MSRSVPEWVGKTDDTPPPPRVKERILRAHENRCALTGREFRPGDEIEFDHIIALSLGGENRETNLQPVLTAPHKQKSRDDARAKRTASRLFKKHHGLAKGSKRKIPGSKGTIWKKRVDGIVERRQ